MNISYEIIKKLRIISKYPGRQAFLLATGSSLHVKESGHRKSVSKVTAAAPLLYAYISFGEGVHLPMLLGFKHNIVRSGHKRLEKTLFPIWKQLASFYDKYDHTQNMTAKEQKFHCQSGCQSISSQQIGCYLRIRHT